MRLKVLLKIRSKHHEKTIVSGDLAKYKTFPSSFKPFWAMKASITSSFLKHTKTKTSAQSMEVSKFILNQETRYVLRRNSSHTHQQPEWYYGSVELQRHSLMRSKTQLGCSCNFWQLRILLGQMLEIHNE